MALTTHQLRSLFASHSVQRFLLHRVTSHFDNRPCTAQDLDKKEAAADKQRESMMVGLSKTKTELGSLQDALARTQLDLEKTSFELHAKTSKLDAPKCCQWCATECLCWRVLICILLRSNICTRSLLLCVFLQALPTQLARRSAFAHHKYSCAYMQTP